MFAAYAIHFFFFFFGVCSATSFHPLLRLLFRSDVKLWIDSWIKKLLAFVNNNPHVTDKLFSPSVLNQNLSSAASTLHQI